MLADKDFADEPHAFMQMNIVIPCVPSGPATNDWGTDDDGCVEVYVREDTRWWCGKRPGLTEALASVHPIMEGGPQEHLAVCWLQAMN
ncbi:MAG: hypothetical protein ACI835_004247 [Planctomycetota bacterium]|jgi:hypothetical protein